MDLKAIEITLCSNNDFHNAYKTHNLNHCEFFYFTSFSYIYIVVTLRQSVT